MVLGLTPVSLADMSARLWEEGTLRERRRKRRRRATHAEVVKNEPELARRRKDERCRMDGRRREECCQGKLALKKQGKTNVWEGRQGQKKKVIDETA